MMKLRDSTQKQQQKKEKTEKEREKNVRPHKKYERIRDTSSSVLMET